MDWLNEVVKAISNIIVPQNPQYQGDPFVQGNIQAQKPSATPQTKQDPTMTKINQQLNQLASVLMPQYQQAQHNAGLINWGVTHGVGQTAPTSVGSPLQLAGLPTNSTTGGVVPPSPRRRTTQYQSFQVPQMQTPQQPTYTLQALAGVPSSPQTGASSVQTPSQSIGEILQRMQQTGQSKLQTPQIA